MTPSPRDKRFGEPFLPGWVKEFRPTQWEKIEEVVGLFNEGVDAVFLEAPTGTGKTLIGEIVRRLLHARCYYTCTTKSLQDQFAHDFPYASVLKGRANYLTYEGNLDFLGRKRRPGDVRPSVVTCADCTQVGMSDLDDNDEVPDCVWCPYKIACPFQQAKAKLVTSELGVLNTNYLLTDSSLPPRDLVIADEGDVLESTIMGHVSITVTPKQMDKFGLRPPQKKTVGTDWVKWLEYAAQVVKEYAQELPQVRDISVVRERTRAAVLSNQMREIAREIPEGGWVYDGYNRNPDLVEFKPTNIAKYTKRILWPKGHKWLLMSATFISPELRADRLGMTDAMSWDTVRVPTGFPKERRPIYYTPVADMSHKLKDEERPKMADAIIKLTERHPDDRILIHTVSYDLSAFIHSVLSDYYTGRPVFTYTNAEGRGRALEDYSASSGSILVASSMDRGIDLPGDLCRVQVITKVPFPNLKDKQISAILHNKKEGGGAWYKMETVSKLVQSSGRGMRSSDDHCTTYILDSQFKDNLWKTDYMFPDWWKEAVRWDLTFQRLINAVR